MKNYILLLASFGLLFFNSCDSNKKSKIPDKSKISQFQKDSIEQFYTVDTSFVKGDARRYGLTPETAIRKHPKVNKNAMTALIDLAEKTGLKIVISKGYYPLNLNLDGRRNTYIHSDEAAFESISITDNNGALQKPKNITITGTLIAYVRLGITEANKIKLDSVYLVSNPQASKSKLRNKGCHIYHGTKDVNIKYLRIDDLGSGASSYEYTHASLAVDGWNNNPQEIIIDEIYIKSSDRHGIYLTGSDHIIGKITIDQFGVGSSENMSGMQDSKPGQEKEFTGIWLNKCINSTIGEIIIDCKNSKGKYAFKFERGDIYEPTRIESITILNYLDDLPLDYPPNVVDIGEIIKK